MQLHDDINKLASAIGADIGTIQRKLNRTDTSAVFADVVKLRQLIADIRADLSANPISPVQRSTRNAQQRNSLNSGMSRIDGKTLTNYAHIQQSIEDILTTPLGSRVMRRDYGITLDLIDQPANGRTMLRLYSEIIRALTKWEPRITVKRVYGNVFSNGTVVVTIESTTNQQFNIVKQPLSNAA